MEEKHRPVTRFGFMQWHSNRSTSHAAELSDLNQDGYPDLIEANSDDLNVYYINVLPRWKK